MKFTIRTNDVLSKTYQFLWLPLVLTAMLAIGCQKKASDEIDFGVVTNGTYRNEFFGMAVSVPTNWSVQDQQSRDRLMAAGQKMLAGDDKNMKAVLKASEMQSVNLLTAFRFPVGSAVRFNPCVACVAEKIGQLPGIQRGKDYLFHARQVLEGGQMKITIPREGFSRKIGGVDFDGMDVDLTVGRTIVHEEYYASIMKNYALSFMITYGDDAQLTEGTAILDTVTLQH